MTEIGGFPVPSSLPPLTKVHAQIVSRFVLSLVSTEWPDDTDGGIISGSARGPRAPPHRGIRFRSHPGSVSPDPPQSAAGCEPQGASADVSAHQHCPPRVKWRTARRDSGRLPGTGRAKFFLFFVLYISPTWICTNKRLKQIEREKNI